MNPTSVPRTRPVPPALPLDGPLMSWTRRRHSRPTFGDLLRLAAAYEMADGARVSIVVSTADHMCSAGLARR